MPIYFVLSMYALLLVGVGLLGGYLPELVRLTHARMQMVISFVGGLMVGIGILHLLPHSFLLLQSIDQTCRGVVAGLAAMFIFLRWFHFHEHELPAHELPEGAIPAAAHAHHHHHDHDHDHGHDHDHDHDSSASAKDHAHDLTRPRPTWVMIFCGLAIHTLLDGLALGASILSDARHNHFLAVGFGTFLAILLHKPLDALTLSSMMMRDQLTVTRRLLLIGGYCLLCPLGAIVFLSGVSQLTSMQNVILGYVLAFSAGIFICIALSDLLPEIEFHSHDRLTLTAFILAGIGVAYSLSWFEPSHLHTQPGVTDKFIGGSAK